MYQTGPENLIEPIFSRLDNFKVWTVTIFFHVDLQFRLFDSRTRAELVVKLMRYSKFLSYLRTNATFRAAHHFAKYSIQVHKHRQSHILQSVDMVHGAKQIIIIFGAVWKMRPTAELINSPVTEIHIVVFEYNQHSFATFLVQRPGSERSRIPSVFVFFWKKT